MSVFSRIRKLFRSDGFPDEDFLTEIVFGFIERYPGKFIAWLRIIKATQLPIDSNLSAATQYHSAESIEDKLPAKRPDMLVWLRAGDDQQVIFLESKVASLPGDNQLEDYARILSKLRTEALRTLLFVTRDYLPQDAERLFRDISGPERPKFIQARWHEFHSFLINQSDLGKDTLVSELLQYMKEQQLDIPNTFTPLDLAALAGFRHALAVMRAVLEGDVAQQFEKTFGSIIDSYDRDVRVAKSGLYVLQIRPSKRGETDVTLGFWFGGDGGEYPALFGGISFDNKTQNKTAVVEALRKSAAGSNGRWIEENLLPTASFGRIYHSVSVKQFLGSEDHVDAMRRYVLEILRDAEEFRNIYPELV